MVKNFYHGKNSSVFAVIVGIIIVSGIVLFNPVSKNSDKKTSPQESPDKTSLSRFFSNQIAIIQGQITQRKGSVLTIKNKAGQTNDFTLAGKVAIYQMQTATDSGSLASYDTENIELNKEAVIRLNQEQEAFKVISITYLPEAPR